MNRKRMAIIFVAVVIILVAAILILSGKRSPQSILDITPMIQVIERVTGIPTEASTMAGVTSTPNPWRETEYQPTCEETGYIVRENMIEGYSVIEEGTPAIGHQYGEWREDPASGMFVATCIHCGKEKKQNIAYDGNIPRIDLSGETEGISKTDRVTLKFDFSSPVESFSCYSYTSWQGHASLKFPKKNYVVRFFDDEDATDKHRITFRNWQREHKYVLKANYRDFSQSRNLIASALWADMAASRPNLFDTLRLTSNYGAVDGFPVIVYLNGEFIGLYTMNLHIDDDLYQMTHENDAVMIANSSEPDETRFHALATFENEDIAWEIEHCGSEDNEWAKESLNRLIAFVMNSDDDEFRGNLDNYLDVDAAIDYLLFLYVTGLQDNAAKDLVLLKYHDCDVWIPSVYDLEHAFGLSNDGLAYLDADEFLPFIQNDRWDSATDSLLWDKLLLYYYDKVSSRYAVLRQNILTEDYFAERVDSFMQCIPDEYYEQDLLLWPRNLPEGKPAEQIKTYFDHRIALLDEIFHYDN